MKARIGPAIFQALTAGPADMLVYIVKCINDYTTITLLPFRMYHLIHARSKSDSANWKRHLIFLTTGSDRFLQGPEAFYPHCTHQLCSFYRAIV